MGAGSNADIDNMWKLLLDLLKTHLFVTKESPDATDTVFLRIARHSSLEDRILPVGYGGYLHIGDCRHNRTRVIGEFHHRSFIDLVIGWWWR